MGRQRHKVPANHKTTVHNAVYHLFQGIRQKKLYYGKQRNKRVHQTHFIRRHAYFDSKEIENRSIY